MKELRLARNSRAIALLFGRRATAALILIVVCGSCAGGRRAGVPARLDDGFYAVLGQAASEAGADSLAAAAVATGAAAAGQARLLLPYDHIYTPDPEEPREWLALALEPYVPLLLDREPELGMSEKGFASLSIALDPKHTALLERFTRDHLNQSVAIVIGGEVVTKHTIKAVITGGQVQITRCTDNACEVLRTRLLDRVSGD
ncbi:MAG: hypothetical protein IPK72_23660 [Candidatus Eisenbacteria bacterium]|nr:hypothetical protein [Candidatus Eisenbacteria bacterium]